MSTAGRPKASPALTEMEATRSAFMPRLRQMPELFLRGALANQTMRHLTDQERRESQEITLRIAYQEPENGGVGARTMRTFIQALQKTIRGDYKDDSRNAEVDYVIAVWRGVVQLLYHRP